LSAIATWVVLLSLLVGYIIACFQVLFKHQNNLEDKKFNETYGAFLQGLNKDNKNSIYVYPVFMLKRLMFTLIVPIFYNLPGFQIKALIILQFSHIVFIIKTKSCSQLRKFVIDMFNESCLLLMFYHLFIFGDSGIVNGTDTKLSVDFKI